MPATSVFSWVPTLTKSLYSLFESSTSCTLSILPTLRSSFAKSSKEIFSGKIKPLFFQSASFGSWGRSFCLSIIAAFTSSFLLSGTLKTHISWPRIVLHSCASSSFSIIAFKYCWAAFKFPFPNAIRCFPATGSSFAVLTTLSTLIGLRYAFLSKAYCLSLHVLIR